MQVASASQWKPFKLRRFVGAKLSRCVIWEILGSKKESMTHMISFGIE